MCRKVFYHFACDCPAIHHSGDYYLCEIGNIWNASCEDDDLDENLVLERESKCPICLEEAARLKALDNKYRKEVKRLRREQVLTAEFKKSNLRKHATELYPSQTNHGASFKLPNAVRNENWELGFRMHNLKMKYWDEVPDKGETTTSGSSSREEQSKGRRINQPGQKLTRGQKAERRRAIKERVMKRQAEDALEAEKAAKMAKSDHEDAE